MAEEKKPKGEQQAKPKGEKQPKREGGKNIWSRVGSAFKNRDGSFNLFLDAFPIGGRVNIREDDREYSRSERGVPAEAEA